MNGLEFYVSEHLQLARELSLKYPDHSYMYLCLTLLITVSYYLFLYRSPSFQDCCLLYISCNNIDNALSLHPFYNIFAFGEFNVHHTRLLKHTVTDLVGIQNINFTITQSLTQVARFLHTFPK